MSSSFPKQYKTCDSITKALLQFTPIWSESSGGRFFKIFLQYYASIFGVVGSISLFDKAYHTSDMNVMTACLVPGIALFMNIFKLMPTVLRTEVFSEVYHELNELLWYSYKSTDAVPIEDSTLNTFSLTMKFLSLSYKLMMFNYIALPLIYLAYQIIINVQPVVLPLPFSGVYSENFTNNGILYTLHFLYEATVIVIGPATSLGVDCFFGLAVFQMISILSALSHQACIPESSADYMRSICQCIDKHCQLIRCGRKIQSIYGQMILSQRLTDGVVLCAIIFQMHQVVGSDMGKFGTYCSWIFLKFTQQLTYGWYGSLLISETEEFKTTIYFSKWTNFYDKNSRKSIAYILQQRPIQIEAFGFFVISIPMASSVISASFSYFFLLQSLDTAE